MPATDDLSTLDAHDQAALVRAGEATARELTEAAISRIDAVDDQLGAVVTPAYELGLRLAEKIDAVSSAASFGGVPMLVKDFVAEIAGVPHREGSRFLRDHVSTETSELVRRLTEGGFGILGKTATPEFGMSPTCEADEYGSPTRNPWDTNRSTSGSSGGSAAAVAAGIVPVAHGNDLGGSLRFPAAACGVFGFKPTRGRNPCGPLYGDFVSGAGVEHVLTRSVRDSAAILDLTSGPAPGDPYPAPPPARPFAAEVGASPGRLRIAYTARTPDGSPAHPDCVAALDDALALLDSLGHELVEADLPGLDAVGEAIGTMFNAATACRIGHWARKLGREPRDHELEPLTRAFYELGRSTPAGDYLLAVGELQVFSRGVADFHERFDAWVTPTMSSLPAPIGHISSTPDQPFRALERGGATVAYPAVVANVTGAPAMSVPLWWNADDLPVGVHVLAGFGDDAALFRLAAQLEEARPWAQRLPQVHASKRRAVAPA